MGGVDQAQAFRTMDGDVLAATDVHRPQDSWAEFSQWASHSGVDTLLSRFPTADPGKDGRSVEQVLEGAGIPRRIASSLLHQFRQDQETHAVSRLGFSAGVTGIEHIGQGATSNVFASVIHDPDALKNNIPELLRLVGIDNGRAPTVTEEVSARIDRISESNSLAVSKVLKYRLEDRTIREIKTALLEGAKLPNIPGVIGGQSTADSLLFHMEHIPGLDVEELLKHWEMPATPVRMNQDLAALCARSIATLARNGILHRDIKPSNFRVRDDGTLYSVDLGFVRNEGSQSQQSIPDGSVGVGTPYYMAPEQARRDAQASSKADVFSLGVMLWRMYTGKYPYVPPNSSVARLMTERLQMYPGTAVPEFIADPTAKAGSDPQRAERFFATLKPMLESMIDADPAKRPDPDLAADFFRQHSSFGDINFDDFMNVEKYHQHRLAMDPLPGDSGSIKHGYPDDGKMFDAFNRGVELRSKQYDFLADRAFDARVQPVESPSRFRNIKTVGGISAAVAALALLVVVNKNKGTTPDSNTVGVVASLDGKKKETDVAQAVEQHEVGSASEQPTVQPVNAIETPKPPERGMELKMSPEGPENFRLFRTESLNIGKENLMPLYKGQGKDRAVAGAGFICAEENIARMLKVADASSIPEGIRSKVAQITKATGGLMGYTLELPDGTRCTWITSVGLMVEDPKGAMHMYSFDQEFTNARKGELAHGGGFQEITTDPASTHALMGLEEITDVGIIPQQWTGNTADRGEWLRATGQLYGLKSQLSAPATTPH